MASGLVAEESDLTFSKSDLETAEWFPDWLLATMGWLLGWLLQTVSLSSIFICDLGTVCIFILSRYTSEHTYSPSPHGLCI